MDGTRFDDVTKALAASAGGISRRAACKLLTGGALAGVLARFGLEETAAACKKVGKSCTKQSQCCSKGCCLAIGAAATGPKICSTAGATCCTAAEGGGYCPNGGRCGLPTPNLENGFCCKSNEKCCSLEGAEGCCPDLNGVCCTEEEGGGCCAEGETCCYNNGEPACCSDASVGAAGAARARRMRVAPRGRK
jgi:hypothetical protein